MTNYLLIYFFSISLLTIIMYWIDKSSARAGGWRISEATLHILSLIGGTPAAYFAQRYFRHKTKKRSFQFTYWAIVFFQLSASITIIVHFY